MARARASGKYSQPHEIKSVDDVSRQPGRGPVTEQEALFFHRELKRRQLERTGDTPVGDDQLPTELPAGDATKIVISQRVSERQRAYLEALAHIQGTTAARIIDVMIYEAMLGEPQSPAEFDARRRELERSVRGRDRVTDLRRDRAKQQRIARLRAELAELEGEGPR
ncbi:hypothetical protein [Catellatospora paridis]|uniref:hypothetical protein n=1 Tax=Catellatospora paridis TaxID=1617086 RepID=UPI0012D448EB|nr:hypothetical protein [Catellatospora paridis]